jgi:hypothetical protein
MFICLLNDDSVVYADEVYCDYGNFKTGFLYDENGNKVMQSGVVIAVLNF